MTIPITLWWLSFFAALGLCIGSFLNVVVYRLPLGLALSRPVWSFCPHCRNPIAWYDNLPVVSYLRLRGRCRNCWRPIAPRYAVVEILTAVTVILLLDAFFIARVRDGFSDAPELTWRLSEDWPILLAHIVLFASLLAMSAIDLQFYWVDIRFTHFAALCGLVLHMAWTPGSSRAWLRPYDGTAVAATAALAGYAVVWLVLQFRAHPPPHPEPDAESDAGPAESAAPDVATAPGRTARIRMVIAPLVLFAFLIITAGADELDHGVVPFALRAGLVLFFFFAVILYEASHPRAADTDIVDAIEAEAPDARRTSLAEFATLAPGIVLGVVALAYVLQRPDAADAATRLIHWQPAHGNWQPLWGLVTAVSGYVIAASIGWTIRIVANVAFGKEAFATGDIHMMAAAGCVLGWQIVLMGFMITCFMAVAAWIALLPFKKTHAIPLGPWLWIGFLTTTLFYKPLENTRLVQNVVEAADVLVFENSQHTHFRDTP